MAKDKLKELITSLVEAQERRIDNENKMRLANVRVGTSGQQYYARVNITTEAIIILPDSEEIPVSHFLPVHLRGYSEVNDRAIRLNQRFNKPHYTLRFRTPRQSARALRRIRSLTGEESTSESLED